MSGRTFVLRVVRFWLACALLYGTLHDWVYMGCLAREFTGPVLGAIFVPDTPRQAHAA